MPAPVLALGLAVLFGTAAQWLFFRHGPGANVPVAVVLFLALCWIVRSRERRVEPRDLWIPTGAVLFAAFCAVRTDVSLVAFDVLAAVSLSVASVVVLGGVRVVDLPLAALAAEAPRAIGSLCVRGAGVVAAAWPHVAGLAGARVAGAGGYVAGLVLALPFVAVFASLFGSADAVFARTAADLFDIRQWLDTLGDVPGRTITGTLGAWVAAGAFARLRAAPPAVAPGPARGWLGVEPATVALVAIDLLFAAFVALQLAYLFGGRDTVAAIGMTHSAYARRGFFELITASTLVTAILFGAELSVRRRVRAYVAAAVALVGLTGAVVISAAYRLDLYQRAYGWTEQRFYALAMIVFLGAALAILAWSILRSRMRWALQPIALAALTVAAGINVLGPSDYVVRANVARILDPSRLPPDAERRLDSWYLATLGDGALPALVELLPSLPEAERSALGRQLRRRVEWRTFAPPPWQSWSLDRERARVAAEGAREALLGYPR